MAASSPTIKEGQIWLRFPRRGPAVLLGSLPFLQRIPVLQTANIRCDEAARLGGAGMNWEMVRATSVLLRALRGSDWG